MNRFIFKKRLNKKDILNKPKDGLWNENLK